MVRPRVAITARSFDLNGAAFSLLDRETEISYINRTGHRLAPPELLHALDGVHAAIAGTEPYSSGILADALCLNGTKPSGESIGDDYGKYGLQRV